MWTGDRLSVHPGGQSAAGTGLPRVQRGQAGPEQRPWSWVPGQGAGTHGVAGCNFSRKAVQGKGGEGLASRTRGKERGQFPLLLSGQRRPQVLGAGGRDLLKEMGLARHRENGEHLPQEVRGGETSDKWKMQLLKDFSLLKLERRGK